jgi:hypothetical protein
MNAINKKYPTLITATLPTMGGYSMSIAIITTPEGTEKILYCYNTNINHNRVNSADIEVFPDTEDILNQGVNTLHKGFRAGAGQGTIYFIDQFCRDNI